MEYRIGIATTDGLVVNQHFGRADSFLIVDVDADGTEEHPDKSRNPDGQEKLRIEAVGQRFVTPVCEGGVHDDARLSRNVELLSDCDFLLVSRIGPGAVEKLGQSGILAYELPGVIEDSIQKVIQYQKLLKLLSV